MGGAEQTAEVAAIPHEPPLSCDIVMKGGITSGVVYPGAVLRLARRYRFRSIGGTSAGAIAAGVVAAAEHNRRGGGFAEVAKLPGELASTTKDCRPFMLQLFQADKPTRPLFDTLISFMQDGKLFAGAGMLARFWKGPLTALVVSAGSIVLSAVAGADPAFAVGGMACAIVIGLVGLVADLLLAVQKISENHFGMCRLGPPDEGEERADALTPWLHTKIQKVAGRTGPAQPLTFADLWGVRPAETDEPWNEQERFTELLDRSRTPRDRVVDLQMVTTDLTHGRPLRLPVPYQPHRTRLEDEAGRLLFDPDEMSEFFPPDVVAHLVRFSEPLVSSKGVVEQLQPDDKNLMRFPIGPDLPVVVATRMSLSFPFLISAIPLWRLERSEHAPPRLDRVVFSDGGVTSNFPIHFFDSPLPTRPTFGLNLTGFDRDESPDLDDPADAVVPPGEVGDRARETVLEIDGLGPFFGALKNAAQNWRDNAQAALPGYRDRIAHIKLAPDEGGMNLVMPPKTIRRMNARGDLAGAELMERFSGADGTSHAKHWNDHRFTRFRVTMGQVERLLQTFARNYGQSDETNPPLEPVTMSYADRIALGGEKPYRYATPDLLEAAETVAKAYVELVEKSSAGPSLDDKDMPRPPSVLRSVPPV